MTGRIHWWEEHILYGDHFYWTSEIARWSWAVYDRREVFGDRFDRCAALLARFGACPQDAPLGKDVYPWPRDGMVSS